MRRFGGIVLVASLAAIAACSRAPQPRTYEVRGQILGVDSQKQEVLMKHEDIPGFMPAMTMYYKVGDPALLEGKQAGDLVTATLVVEEVNGYLSALTTTGRAPLDPASEAPAITDSDLLKEGDLVSAYALVDQTGTPRPIDSLRGHRLALTFIYSRCPMADFCPLMDKQFAQVQDEIRKAPGLADVRLVSVTLDPEFDTPAVLAQHAKKLGADPRTWYFMTGDRDAVLEFAKRFGVVTEPGEPAAPVVHNLRTAVIDSQGRLVKTYSGSAWSPAELVADLRTIPASAN